MKARKAQRYVFKRRLHLTTSRLPLSGASFSPGANTVTSAIDSLSFVV
jgi:hypothetical protein